jgi:DNA internalization-related competence protein ComEC/Rec2
MQWNEGWYFCACALSGFLLAIFNSFNLFAFCWIVPLLSLGTWLSAQQGWKTALKAVLIFLCTWGYTTWRMDHQKNQQPKLDRMDRAYQIHARIMDCDQTTYGHRLRLKSIEVLRPERVPFKLQQLTVYTPELDQLPKVGSAITAWVQLKQRHATRPIPWPMARWREAYWPQTYGTVKTLQLVEFTEFQNTHDDHDQGLNQGNRELLAALLRNQPSPLWLERLQPFGLGHLLAVSGLHFGLFFLMLQMVFAPLRNVYFRLLMTLLALVGFATWMGGTASVTRAFSMLSLWLLLPFFSRQRLRVRLWMGVLLGCLIVDPLLLLRRGFWYTFVASIGLILGYRYTKPSPLEHPWLRRLRPFLPIVAAQCLVTPVHLIFSVEARWDSLLWNLFGVFFLSVIGLLLFSAILASLLPALVPLANSFESFIAYLLALSDHLPNWTILRFPMDPMWILVFLGFCTIQLAIGKREWRWYACLAALVICLQLGKPKPVAQWIMFDVGQGACMLYVDGQGGGWLFDAGGRLPSQLHLDQLLRLHGVEEIKAAFVSHCNKDHYNLLEMFDKSEPIYVPHTQMAAFQQLPPPLGEREWIGLAKGDRLSGNGFEMEVIWPPADSAIQNRNESGLVLSIVHEDGFRVLLMGDAGNQVEKQLGRIPPPDILQVGHHGSRTATSRSFLQQLNPKEAWISCGRKNRFGHPHPIVLDILNCHSSLLRATPWRGTFAKQRPK